MWTLVAAKRRGYVATMDEIEKVSERSSGAWKGRMEDQEDLYLFLRDENYEEEETGQ